MQTCAWHPDRETFISCTRCGRPICPACMTQAPVGFHCPACINEARQVLRRTRPRTTTSVTQALIATNVAIHGLGFLGIGTNSGFVREFGMLPAAVAYNGEWWRMFTAAFVHAGALHLAMNMIMLWVMGRGVEQVLGRGRFVLLYVLSIFGGGVASYLVNDPLTFGVGASGAIFGLFAAVFMFGREYGRNNQEIGFVIGLNLLLGFVIPGVDWLAHAGGLVTGAVVSWALLPRRRRPVDVIVVAAVAAVLIALVQWRTMDLVANVASVLA